MRRALSSERVRVAAAAPPPRELVGLVRRGLSHRGCYLIANGAKPRFGPIPFGRFPDRTGVECFANKKFTDDYASDADARLGVAIRCALSWEFALGVAFPRTRFRFIVSRDDTGSSSVRFHAIREGENVLGPELELYEENEVLELETGEATLVAIAMT